MTQSPEASVRALIAYDGSSGADDAVRAAARLLPGAHATVVHVRGEPVALDRAALARIAVPDAVLASAAEEYERAAQARSRELVEQGRRLAEREGVSASAEVRAGTSVWREVESTADQLDADVMVCGTRGQGSLARALLGSTSSSLLHQAERPVLIVPAGAGDDDRGGPAVLAYDGSDGARAAIAAAARLLAERPAVVVHAWSSPLERSYASDALELVPLPEVDELVANVDELFGARGSEVAEEGAALAREAGLNARATAVRAQEGAWRAVAAAASAERAAVIVVGSRGRGALASTMLGSVSAGLAHNAELPVLIVR